MSKSFKEWQQELIQELEYGIKRVKDLENKEDAEGYTDSFYSNIECYIRGIEDISEEE